ncbi:CaiF/GrlA family transcriptional regulator [Serratia marcescens]|uniref:CaiF/GrlA family transcriptional regulator n=1 Tax=Serratia marcescens TaxID=615 RepID=UPI0040456DE9
MSNQSKPNPASPPVMLQAESPGEAEASVLPRIDSLEPVAESKAPPRQGSHDAFYRPACLSHLPVLPLYLTVAHWGWCSGNVLTAAAIGEAFRLELRRAQTVMRYFARYETHVSFVRPWRGAIRVTALPPLVAGRKVGVRRGVTRKGGMRDPQSLRRWFLQQSNGVPEA